MNKQPPPHFEDALAAFERVLGTMKITPEQKKQVQDAIEAADGRQIAFDPKGNPLPPGTRLQFRHDQFMAGANALSKITGKQIPELYSWQPNPQSHIDATNNAEAAASFHEEKPKQAPVNTAELNHSVASMVHDKMLEILGFTTEEGYITEGQYKRAQDAIDNVLPVNNYQGRIEAMIETFKDDQEMWKQFKNIYRAALAVYKEMPADVAKDEKACDRYADHHIERLVKLYQSQGLGPNV